MQIFYWCTLIIEKSSHSMWDVFPDSGTPFNIRCIYKICPYWLTPCACDCRPYQTDQAFSTQNVANGYGAIKLVGTKSLCLAYIDVVVKEIQCVFLNYQFLRTSACEIMRTDVGKSPYVHQKNTCVHHCWDTIPVNKVADVLLNDCTLIKTGMIIAHK